MAMLAAARSDQRPDLTGRNGDVGPNSRFARACGPMGRWLLAIAVAGAALAIGTIHTTVLAVEACLFVVSAILLWAGAEPARMRPAATVLAWTCVALTVWTALQCIPLPVGWLAAISPRTA